MSASRNRRDKDAAWRDLRRRRGAFAHRRQEGEDQPDPAGTHAVKDHRSFKWLPWVLGKVSCTKLVAGVRYAGHFGTYGGPTTIQTLRAQAAWRNAVNANLIVPVAAFNPVGPNLPGNAALNLKGEGAEFYGAYKANGTMYTVVLTVKGNGGNVRRIAKVVRMPTTRDIGAF